MGLADSGFDARACLDFDLSVLEFGEAFERAAQATKEVPAPERSRKRPATVQVPRHGEADLRRWLEVLGRLGPANYTSMAQDAMAGRRTEVDIFAGEVIQRGAALGVDVPVNATLYGLLKAAEPWLV